jgi:hypothetical protein
MHDLTSSAETARVGAVVVRGDGRLNGHPCFAACSPGVLRRIERRGTCVTVSQGTCVQPIARLQWVYFILSGIVAVDDGCQVFLVGSGGTVGLGAAFTRSLPIVSIEAAMPTDLFVASNRDLCGAAQDNPSFLVSLTKHMAQHTQIL